MALSRVHRLVRLITLLQGETGLHAQDLMDELGISRRTLFRDLASLKDSGVPVYYDAQQGYRLQRGFFLPPINLSVSEVVGLLLLGKFAAADRRRPMTVPAVSAIRKLIASVPEEIRDACQDMVSAVEVKPDRELAQGDTEAEHYTTLQQCIDQRRACRVVYHAPLGESAMEMEVDPYLLHFANRAWYVMGWTDLYDEVRVLKLVRIKSVELLNRRFDRPANFRASDKLGNAWQLIPGGKEYDVELEFTPRVATNVTEVRWHPTQRHEWLDDGRAVVRFRVDGIDEIAWWVCGYADQVVVRKPVALSDRVRAMHAAAASVGKDRR